MSAHDQEHAQDPTRLSGARRPDAAAGSSADPSAGPSAAGPSVTTAAAHPTAAPAPPVPDDGAPPPRWGSLRGTVTALSVAAAGLACAATAYSAETGDLALVCATGALASVLLGVVLALFMSRSRVCREVRLLTRELDEAVARTNAARAESEQRAAAGLEAAQRAVREAEVRRRTAAEGELSLRAAFKSETAKSAVLEGETMRFAEVTVPLVLEILRSGGSAEDVMARVPVPAGAAHLRLLEVLVREVRSGEQARSAARTACANAAGRIQALTEELHAGLRTVADRYGAGEPQGAAMLADLLTLDDQAARTGRLADGIAVLAGAPPARRWPDALSMDDVLHGALSRIDGMRRVRLRVAGTASVAGHAAEGVMHALAELLDNACAFSPPSEAVHVEVHDTASGVAVSIDDAGPGIPDEARADALRLISGEPLDPRTLPADGIGLAVVGRLARTYGLLVSLQGSPRGGTGALLIIPPTLLQTPPALAPNGGHPEGARG